MKTPGGNTAAMEGLSKVDLFCHVIRIQTPRTYTTSGTLLLAVPMFYFEVLHLSNGQAVSHLVPLWIPFRLFWAYFTGTALIASGFAIILRKQDRLAAFLLGEMLLSFVFLIHAPNILRAIIERPADFVVLWNTDGSGGLSSALKDVALTISVFLLASADPRFTRRNVYVMLLRIAYASVIVLFGIEHFLYTRLTPGISSATFVPFWIPVPLMLSYLSGALFVICAALTLVTRTAHQPMVILAVFIVLATLFTYGFRLLAHQGNTGALISTATDLAIAGGALILAGHVAENGQLGEIATELR